MLKRPTLKAGRTDGSDWIERMALLWEHSLAGFIVITILLGGGAAWTTGRATALSWSPIWQMMVYVLLLGLAVRFFHYALLEETLLNVRYYVSDTMFLIVAAALGYRLTRARQMARQYPWLYRRTSPLTWKRID